MCLVASELLPRPLPRARTSQHTTPLLESFPWRPPAWSQKSFARLCLVRPCAAATVGAALIGCALFADPGALDGDGFGFRPAPSVAPDFASLPSVLPDLPAVANLPWQPVDGVGAPVDAASVSLQLDEPLVSAPNFWGALLPAVAPVTASTASPAPPPLPPPLPPQPLPLMQSPRHPSADSVAVSADSTLTTLSSAPEISAVAATPALNDRSALLASLQTDNPLARLKKSSTTRSPPRQPLPSSAASPSLAATDAGGFSPATHEQLMPAATVSDPHASLMNAILLGPKLRSTADRPAPGPRPTVAETPREALMEAIKARTMHALRARLRRLTLSLAQTSAASRLRSASQPASGAQPQRAAAPVNDVMSDLASSIMRRRASIEPQEEEDDDGELDARESRVLGLRAYLASKESGRSTTADAQDDWE